MIMAETDARAAVVASARRWIGTPYHHMADVPGMGVDCLMLLVRVYGGLGLIPAVDPRPYPQYWHLHRSEERYLSGVLDHAREVAEPGPGDVVLWRVGRTFSHAGIVTVWTDRERRVVHAYARARYVRESDLLAGSELTDTRRHPRRFFSPWAGRPMAV